MGMNECRDCGEGTECIEWTERAECTDSGDHGPSGALKWLGLLCGLEGIDSWWIPDVSK
jgi:hypothetical protein